jgi:hypothetical protein
MWQHAYMGMRDASSLTPTTGAQRYGARNISARSCVHPCVHRATVVVELFLPLHVSSTLFLSGTLYSTTARGASGGTLMTYPIKQVN